MSTCMSWVFFSPWISTPSLRYTKRAGLLVRMAGSVNRAPAILVTNDDGIESKALRELAKGLQARVGSLYKVVIVAPGRNQSACSMKLTIGSPLKLHTLVDREQYVLEDGTPADCVVAALEPEHGILHRLGLDPVMVVSGINLGPNVGSDVVYSGTFAGARQSNVFGLPGLAASIADYDLDDEAISHAVEATVELVVEGALPILAASTNHGRFDQERRWFHQQGWKCESREKARQALREGFAEGDIVVNLNIPRRWSTRKFRSTRLGAIFYRNVVVREQGHKDVTITIGGPQSFTVEDWRGWSDDTDVAAVRAGYASVTTLNAWPETHPLQLPASVIQYVMEEEPTGSPGYPFWMGR